MIQAQVILEMCFVVHRSILVTYRGDIIKHSENYIRFVEVDSFVYSCCRVDKCRLDEDDDDDRWPRDHNWRVDGMLR